MAEKVVESLSFKWGTVNGWAHLSPATQDCLKRFWAEGIPASAMMDRPRGGRVDILCEAIDGLADDGELWNDWNGCAMSKDEAKEYVRGYNER